MRARKPEGARELVYVGGDPHRVAVRRRVTLVDDVRERLERGRHLAAQADDAGVETLDEQQERCQCDRDPDLVQRGEREHDPEPDRRRGRDDVGQHDTPVDQTLEQGPHGHVDEACEGDRQHVVRQMHLPGDGSGRLEREAARQRRQGQRDRAAHEVDEGPGA